MGKLIKYGIYGAIERIIAARIGKATMNITFSGGALDSSGVVPATFATKNAFEQKIVESHPEFKSGAIKVLYSQDIDEPKVEEAKEHLSVPEVTSLQQARQYLMDKMGVPMEKMQSKAKVLEAAKEKGVTFPNL